jgi:sterol desaturase/sphingolipid hydroxylase (fatty acid hydroxylase superfamily)
MTSLKRLAWSLALLAACSLVAVATWQTQLRGLLDVHKGAGFYLLLAGLLIIPANLLSLTAGYAIELLFVGWERSSLKLLFTAHASVRLDALAMLAMDLLPHRRLGWVLSLGLLYVLDGYAARHANLSLTHWLPWWGLQIIALELFQSCARYWMHRLEHTIPALWALHKFHHSAEEMSILTTQRQTQLVQGVENTILLVPVLLMADPTAALPSSGSPAFVLLVLIFVYHTFVHVNGYLVHSNMQTGYGWIGRWLLVSPRMHRLHHATDPNFHNKNFSFDLVLWDRLFGTYAAQERQEGQEPAPLPIGLHDNPFNHDASFKGVLREYFLTTYKIFWQEIKKGVRAWTPFTSTIALSATHTLAASAEPSGPFRTPGV